jgi:hypothetical protein
MKVVFLSLWVLMAAVTALANADGIPNGGIGHHHGIGNQFHGAQLLSLALAFQLL